MAGFDSQAFLVDSLEPVVRSIIYNDLFVFNDAKNGGLFVDRPNRRGDEVRIPIEYSFTSNGAIMGSHTDAMPESDDSDGVIATFSKDMYQFSLRTYRLLEDYGTGLGDTVEGSILANEIARQPKIMASLNAMKSTINSTCVSDMETMVDSAGTFSGASLTRSTYGLASYEDTSGGTLSMTQLEDGIASLMSPTYGEAMQEDLVIYAPLGQMKRISRFSGTVGTETAASNFPITVSAQDPGMIDVGRFGKTKSFDGIPLIYCPTMTTTNVLILRKNTWGRYPWKQLEMMDKTQGVMGYQALYHGVLGIFVVCDFPSWNGKISGLDA